MGPAVQRAYNYLTHRLQRLDWQPGHRLPAIRKLASLAGVSPVPMSKAVARCKAERLLHTIPGGGIFAGAYAEHSEDPAGKVSLAWKRTQQRLYHDVLVGAFAKEGKLPSIDELIHRYGVSYPTITKALESLVAHGVLKHERRTYSVSMHGHRGSSYGLNLVVFDRWNNSEQIKDPRILHPILTSFEEFCSSGTARLQLMPLEALSTLRKKAARMLGYVFFIRPGTKNEKFFDEQLKILYEARSHGVPVALFDCSGETSLPRSLFAKAAVRLFRLAASEAGRQLGQYLVELGHRRVVYLSPNLKQPWSLARYRGLTEAFAMAGMSPEAVHPASLFIRIWHTGDIAVALSPWNKQELQLVHRLFYRARYPDFKAFLEYLSFIQRATASIPKIGTVSRVYHRQFLDLIHVHTRYQAKLPMSVFHEYRSYLERQISSIINSTHFTSALKISDATAWVAHNDNLAVQAIDFLQQNKRAVPRDISVMGFDNTHKFRRRSLSTYDFAPGRAAKEMIGFLLDARRQRKKATGPRVMEVPGYVVARLTTAPPAKHSPQGN